MFNPLNSEAQFNTFKNWVPISR